MRGHTLGDIAHAIGATLEGLAERAVGGMASLEDAGPSELCFAESPDLLDKVRATAAAGVIVNRDFPAVPSCNLLRVANVTAGVVRAMELFCAGPRLAGTHFSAIVADDAKIGDRVGIGPLVVVEPRAVIGAGSQIAAGAYIGRGVRIGADCAIGANALLLDGSVIGNRCILHPGVLLGGDAFDYHWMDGHHHKVPQLGGVVLEDDVEIGAYACIDRATMGETRIGRGSKLDKRVHVGAGEQLGRDTLLHGQGPAAEAAPLMSALQRQQAELAQLRDRIARLEGHGQA